MSWHKYYLSLVSDGGWKKGKLHKWTYFRVGSCMMGILILCFTFAACAVYESRVDKDLSPLPESFQHHLSGEGESILSWWHLFGDEQLNAFMGQAFSHNQDLAKVYAQWKSFQAQYLVDEANRRPWVNLEGAAERTRTPSPLGATTTNNFSLSLAASYEVDLWQKLKSVSDASRWELLSSKSNIQALYVSIAAQVADFYYTIIEQKAQLKLLDSTIERYWDALELVEHAYQQGLVSALDVYQARQNLAGALARRPYFEVTLAEAQHALSVLLGTYPDSEIGGDRRELPSAPPPLPVGIPAEVLKQRPDVQAALQRLRAADARVGAAVADRFPSFNLLASLGSTSPEIEDLFGSGTLFWQILGKLIQPLLDWGKRRSEVERQKAFYEEFLATYHQVVLEAFKDVEDALVKNQKSETILKRLESLVDISAGALELAAYRYLQGLINYLPVLTAQQDYYGAQSELIAMRRQLLSDRIQLARALGGSWSEALVNVRLSEGLEDITQKRVSQQEERSYQ